MQVRVDAVPEVARPGVGVAMVSRWRLGSPDRQRAAVDAIRGAWLSRPWPDAGIISYSVFAGEDGDTLLHYSQWRDLTAYERFVRSSRDERNAEIDAAVPGIERIRRDSYELYRSRVVPGPARVPGCVVVVEVDFVDADAARQRSWVDTVFTALDSEPRPHPAGISGHFHLSLDGTRVLNYAEWETASRHREAMAQPGDGIGSPTGDWRRVAEFPGQTGAGAVSRYVPEFSLRPA